MPVRRTTKPFEPKPNTPGATIAWTQVHADGTTSDRAGTVWALAPTAANCVTVWVTPDQPLPTDPYHVIAVAVLPRNRARKIGWVRDEKGFLQRERAYADLDEMAPLPRIPAGAAYSEDHEYTLTGALGHGAASYVRTIRRAEEMMT